MPSKGWFIFLPLLIALIVNTTQKNHICDHEQPIPSSERLKLSSEIRNRMIRALEFKTVSVEEGSSDIYSEEFVKFWKFIFEQYPAIFDSDSPQVKVDRIEFEDGKETILVIVKGRDSSLKPGLFISHADVVPAIREEWTHDPFKPHVTEEFVQARGAYDCKSILMAQLEALDALLRNGEIPPRDSYFLFPHDEEIGGFGAQEAAKILQRNYNVQTNGFAFIVDEGMPPVKNSLPGINKPLLLIGYTAKGYLTVELTVNYAKAGHASIPERESSITILARTVDRINANQQPNQFGSSIEVAMMEGLVPYVSWTVKPFLANLWLFRPIVALAANFDKNMNAVFRTTSAVTIFDAGYKSNVIPIQARAVVNLRIHPGQTIAQVLAHLKRVIDDERVVITQEQGGLEADKVTPMNSLYGKKIKHSLNRTIKNVIAIPGIFLAACDARWLQQFSDHIFRFYPFVMEKEDLPGIHGREEKLRWQSYEDGINFYLDFFRHMDEQELPPGHTEL